MSPRRYASAVRVEHTALTRRRILDAAGAAFLERGYLGTTLKDVASAAGVSVQTLYNAVGSKPQLLKAVYDVRLAGDDDAVPIADRPAVQAMVGAPDAHSCLAAYARLGRSLAERTTPLLVRLLSQAGTGDADLQSFAAAIDAERLVGATRVAHLVHDRFGLRPGLSTEHAADLLWTLTAPDVADRLANQRDWGWDRFETWLATAMTEGLTGGGTAPPTRTPS